MMTNRYYNTIVTDKKELIKHVPPANKEWKNSVYSYNKNLIKDTFFKDDNAYYTMKSYLNSDFSNLKSTKSMRMRSYIKRSSTKKIFVSKPFVKQTTNKAIVTLYVFDRENQLFKSNIFLLNKFLKKNNSFLLKNSFLKKDLCFKGATFKSKRNLTNKELTNKRYVFKKHMNNYKLNYNLLPKVIIPSLSKNYIFKDLFMYSFLKWLLQKNFGVLINTFKYCSKCSKYLSIDEKPNKFCSNCGAAYKINSVKLIIHKNNKELLAVNNVKLNNIKKINIVLSKCLNNFLSKVVYNNRSITITNLFHNFLSIKNTFFITKIFNKEYNILSRVSKLNFNSYKYTSLLSQIKNYIGSMFMKKIEFNLVNLKYLHLNSDIFMEALAIKLRKKLSLLEVLKRSLHLVKRPSEFSGMLESKDSLNDKNLSVLPKNTLNTSLLKKKGLLDIYNFDTINNILYSLKYKWISGIRLEAKGRLTKRYTASRAVFKYITKGNLRNLDKYYNSEFDTATPNVYLIRNQFKPNLQHSYVYSNKRIGTFGLKGWINSV